MASKIQQLQQEMQACVAVMDFEKAVKLRDQIEVLKANEAKVRSLKEQMEALAANCEFEKAAQLRDEIKQLQGDDNNDHRVNTAEIHRNIQQLEQEMRELAQQSEYEKAAEIRDKIKTLKDQLGEPATVGVEPQDAIPSSSTTASVSVSSTGSRSERLQRTAVPSTAVPLAISPVQDYNGESPPGPSMPQNTQETFALAQVVSTGTGSTSASAAAKPPAYQTQDTSNLSWQPLNVPEGKFGLLVSHLWELRATGANIIIPPRPHVPGAQVQVRGTPEVVTACKEKIASLLRINPRALEIGQLDECVVLPLNVPSNDFGLLFSLRKEILLGSMKLDVPRREDAATSVVVLQGPARDSELAMQAIGHKLCIKISSCPLPDTVHYMQIFHNGENCFLGRRGSDAEKLHVECLKAFHELAGCQSRTLQVRWRLFLPPSQPDSPYYTSAQVSSALTNLGVDLLTCEDGATSARMLAAMKSWHNQFRIQPSRYLVVVVTNNIDFVPILKEFRDSGFRTMLIHGACRFAGAGYDIPVHFCYGRWLQMVERVCGNPSAVTLQPQHTIPVRVWMHKYLLRFHLSNLQQRLADQFDEGIDIQTVDAPQASPQIILKAVSPEVDLESLARAAGDVEDWLRSVQAEQLQVAVPPEKLQGPRADRPLVALAQRREVLIYVPGRTIENYVGPLLVRHIPFQADGYRSGVDQRLPFIWSAMVQAHRMSVSSVWVSPMPNRRGKFQALVHLCNPASAASLIGLQFRFQGRFFELESEQGTPNGQSTNVTTDVLLVGRSSDDIATIQQRLLSLEMVVETAHIQGDAAKYLQNRFSVVQTTIQEQHGVVIKKGTTSNEDRIPIHIHGPPSDAKEASKDLLQMMNSMLKWALFDIQPKHFALLAMLLATRDEVLDSTRDADDQAAPALPPVPAVEGLSSTDSDVASNASQSMTSPRAGRRSEDWLMIDITYGSRSLQSKAQLSTIPEGLPDPVGCTIMAVPSKGGDVFRDTCQLFQDRIDAFVVEKFDCTSLCALVANFETEDQRRTFAVCYSLDLVSLEQTNPDPSPLDVPANEYAKLEKAWRDALQLSFKTVILSIPKPGVSGSVTIQGPPAHVANCLARISITLGHNVSIQTLAALELCGPRQAVERALRVLDSMLLGAMPTERTLNWPASLPASVGHTLLGSTLEQAKEHLQRNHTLLSVVLYPPGHLALLSGPAQAVQEAEASILAAVQRATRSLVQQSIPLGPLEINFLAGQHYAPLKELLKGMEVAFEAPRSFVATNDQPLPPVLPVATARVGDVNIEVLVGSIVDMDTVTIVNAANERLAHGGGIAKVIADAAGVGLDQAGTAALSQQGLTSLLTGTAITTPSLGLATRTPIQHIVHTVVPVYDAGNTIADILYCNAVQAALMRAEELMAPSLAIPLLGSGIYRWPPDEAADLMARTIAQCAAFGMLTHVRRIVLVDIHEDAAQAMAEALRRLHQRPLSVPTKTEFIPQQQWFWQDDRNQWIPYDADQNTQIELAFHHFQEGAADMVEIMGDVNGQFSDSRHVPVGRLGAVYEVYFTRMAQRNVVSGFYREVMRQPSGLPPLLIPVPTSSATSSSSVVVEFIPPDNKAHLTLYGTSGNVVSDAVLKLKQHLKDNWTEREIIVDPDVSFTRIVSWLETLAPEMKVEITDTDMNYRCLRLRALDDLMLERALVKVERFILSALASNRQQLLAPPENWDAQIADIEVFDVHQGEELDEVSARFLERDFAGKIVHVERIQHRELWREYAQRRQRIAEANGGDANEVIGLKHGTNRTPPQQIIHSDKGIDHRYCEDGYYGRAAYFAEESEYSHHGYCYLTPNGQFQMFLVRIAAGNVEQRHNIDRGIRHPANGFHSVRGPVRGHHQAYMVYELYQAYPEYLVTYTY